MARKIRDDDTKEPRRVGRADELYGLPLDQFTAARDRLVKSLRAAGDRDAADQVKALRKPNTTVWAVNQLVRRLPREMERFFKAADRLRAAQRAAFGPGGGEGLRAASEQLRSQIAELVAAARELLAEAGARADIKALEAVRSILQAAPTAPDRERRRFERGTLTEPLRPAQFSEVLAMMGGRGKLRLLPPPAEKKEEPQEKERKAARRAAEEERARRLSAERERALARRAAKEEQAQKSYERRERARQAEARRTRDEARREAVRAGKAAERAAATARRVALAAERAEAAALRAREQADAAEEAAETARARAAEAELRVAEAEAELVEEPRRASRR